MSKPTYVHSSTLATMCGITKAAVSNWIVRGVNLMEPDAYMSSGYPLWTMDKAAAIAKTYREKHLARMKNMEKRFKHSEEEITTQLLEVNPDE